MRSVLTIVTLSQRLLSFKGWSSRMWNFVRKAQ